MRVLSLAIAATLVGVITLPSQARAQRPVRFGAAAGVTPVFHGNWDRGYAGGAHALLTVERERMVGPLGLRVDAFVHGFRRETLGGSLSRRTTVPGASASIRLPVGSEAARVRPYVLAGGGTYRTEYGGGRPEWHFGASGGGGLQYRLGSADVFVEARLHQVYDGSTPRMVPISFGLRF